MRVILLENILSLGKKGETKEVNDGYAMNYLLPHKKAIVATVSNIFKLQQALVSPQAKTESYQKIYKILNNQSVSFSRKVSDKGHLFQAIGPLDISTAVAENYNINLKSKWFKRPLHFKALGEFQAEINIPEQPVLTLRINIKAE